MEQLRFGLSIPKTVSIDDIYHQTYKQANTDYILKAIIVFLGAHYQVLIKTKINYNHCWVLYDDQKIEPIGTFVDVIHLFLKSGIQPTNLIYEKIN